MLNKHTSNKSKMYYHNFFRLNRNGEDTTGSQQDPSGLTKFPLVHRPLTLAEAKSSCLDRCLERGMAWHTRRSKQNSSSSAMFTLSLAIMWWLFATISANASQENLQPYLGRPNQHKPTLQQLSLEQSFYMPTRSGPSTTKLASTSVGSLQQLQVNPHPQEQSRLAKLCQQTSNVLASVLPAPFGGLKRSILCQFFGQVPLKGSPEDESPQTSIAVMQHVAPHTGYPTIALPLSMSAKHPIELVIDQHRRDYLLAMQQQSNSGSPNNGSAQDLGTSSSILDYAYEKRVEVPKKLATTLKNSGFSSTLEHIFRPATRPQIGSSPLISTSGWRIFNQLDSTTSTPKPYTHSSAKSISTSTTGNNSSSIISMPANTTGIPDSSTKSKDDIRTTLNDVAKEEKISMLVIGKPPQKVNQHQMVEPKADSQTSTTKRMESTKSTNTHSASINPPLLEPQVRTIEINAQIMNTSTIVLAPVLVDHKNASNEEPATGKTKPELNQAREELVIASINNLTRIAFGNHLRDTVKVINKLIDQQSGLFSNVAGGINKDPMVSSESKLQLESVPKPSSTPKPSSNSNKGSTTTLKPNSRKPTLKDGRPNKSRFLKQALSQQGLSTTTKSTGKKPTESPFNFPEASEDWRRLSGPKIGSSSKGKQISKAAVIGEMQQDRSPWLVSSARQSKTTTTSEPRISFQSWLSPDRSFTVSTAEDASLNLERKWDSKKQLPANNHQTSGLVLNRLNKDKLAKRDSLTTLKSYLTTRPPFGTTFSASSQWTSAQSRWMPTVVLPGPKQLHQSDSSRSTSSTTASPISTITTHPSSSFPTSTSSTNIVSTSSSTKANSSPPAKDDHAIVSNEVLPSSEAVYEARATDSINKYTTHLNDANELLATTRRLSLQPLPQTAQTGEFFSVDTIASWPERYQTRIGQALEASTASMSDTTRRNGETYQSTSLSRHRMDLEPTGTTLSMAPLTTLYSTSRMTTLPANHKLTSPLDYQPSTVSLPSQTNSTPSTSGRTTVYSTPSPHSVAYTLIGPYTQNDSELETATDEEFPLIAAENPHGLPIYIEQPFNGSSGATSLRPPYAEQHYVPNHPQSIDELDSLTLVDRDQHHSNQTYAQQKFLEMLSPSFVSGELRSYPVTPSNQQRFNLSALKFLSQNFLSGRQNHKGSNEPLYTQNESTLWQDQQLAGEMKESQVNISSPLQVRSFLDLLSDAAWFSQMQANHYDSNMFNDSRSSHNSSASGFNKVSKSILTRAGNLLSDLKQLEQKQAAALLAAIRYQVPGPLVKPWEISPSFYNLAGGNSDSDRRISSRLDSDSSRLHQDYLVEDLMLNKLIRMALRKQRLVPRSVLEVKLRQADKREDDVVVEPSLHSIEDTDQLAFDKPLEFRSSNLYDSSRSDVAGISMKTATKRLVSKLLNREASSVSKDYAPESSNHGHSDIGEHQDIRLDEKQAESKPIRDDSNWSKSGRANPSLMNSRGFSGIRDEKKLTKEEVKVNFECANRAAGFYPDAATTCRTFYHCSSTGHLLTFNCPQQSRFDEKSLKCGPWYEVSCDLGRIR